MLGMEDGVITFVWIATVVSAVGCAIFGAVMWNKGGEDSK
ncbi:symporter small accessory protein [Fictibacillus halophilus]